MEAYPEIRETFKEIVMSGIKKTEKAMKKPKSRLPVIDKRRKVKIDQIKKELKKPLMTDDVANELLTWREKEEEHEARLSRDLAVVYLVNTGEYSYKEISEIVSCSTSLIEGLVDKYKPLLKTIQGLGLYRNHKADFLEGAALEMLKEAMNPEKIKASTAKQLIDSAMKLESQSRLEQDKSTSNVSVNAQVIKKFLE